MINRLRLNQKLSVCRLTAINHGELVIHARFYPCRLIYLQLKPKRINHYGTRNNS